MFGLVIAKESPHHAMWQTIVVILAAVALLAMFVYAANRFRQR